VVVDVGDDLRFAHGSPDGEHPSTTRGAGSSIVVPAVAYRAK
jgi:hypothetical protein